MFLSAKLMCLHVGLCSAPYFHLKAIKLVGVCVLGGNDSINNWKAIPALSVQPFVYTLHEHLMH